jgi:hypothetical protein
MCKPLFAFLLVFIVAQSTPKAARGAPGGSGRASKEKAAKKACIIGNVKVGIDILADLYVDTGDPNYIFNQARCNEQNHRWEDASDRFREYLRKAPKLTDSEKTEVNVHIAECDSMVAKQAGATAPVPHEATSQAVSKPAPSTASANYANTGAAYPPSAQAVFAQPLPPKSDGRGLRIAGIATAGAGLCAITTGIVLALKERSLTNEINAKFNADKESTRASYVNWGYVSYGVGAAAVVAGATLYVLGWRSERAASGTTGISLLPTYAPGITGMALQGSF